MATSSLEGEFWQNLPYRPKIERRRDYQDDSDFPYRPRPRRNAVPRHESWTWQPWPDAVAILSKVLHDDQHVGVTTHVTADHSSESFLEQNSGHISSREMLLPTEDDLDERLLSSLQKSSIGHQSVELVLHAPFEGADIYLRQSERASEDMAKSWWNRYVLKLSRPGPADIWERIDGFLPDPQPGCSCSECASPQTSPRSVQVSVRSRPIYTWEIDSLRTRFMAFTGWFRRHRQSWSQQAEAPPPLKRLQLQDTNLDIERTQICNELAMVQGLLRCLADTLAWVQGQDQARASLIREYKRLKDQEMDLVDHLQYIEHELDLAEKIQNWDTCEFSDFSHESIIPTLIQDDAWKLPRMSFVEDRRADIQPADIAEAEAELDLYNKTWGHVQRSVTDPSLDQTRLVPWYVH
jgi:hypothetical protein